MRVLVVDDNKKTATFVSKALESDGFTVGVLHDGDEALQAILENHFDAVVLDIMLQGRDGSNIVDVYIRKLREKIDSGHSLKLLHSVRGEGYVMREEP